MKNQVVELENGVVRHKIYNFRKKNRQIAYEQGNRLERYRNVPSGKTLFIYDKGDKLTFAFMNYTVKNGVAERSGVEFLTLSYKNGKCNIYHRTGRYDHNMRFIYEVRCISNRLLPDLNTYSGNKKAETPKEWNRRINRVLKTFVKRHGIGVKFKIDDDYRNVVRWIVYPNTSGLKLNDARIPTKVTDLLKKDKSFVRKIVKRFLKTENRGVIRAFGRYLMTYGEFGILHHLQFLAERIDDPNHLVTAINYATDNNIKPRNDYLLNKKPRITDDHMRAQMLNYENVDNSIRRLLNFMNDTSLNRLLTDYAFLGSYHILQDTARMCRDDGTDREGTNINDVRWANINELHDHLANIDRRQYRRNVLNGTEQDFEIPIRDEWKHLDGLESHGWTFILPKSRNELYEWGQEMHNCIGGYARYMADGTYLLIAAKYNDKMIYNIMINNNRITQFYGSRNRPPALADDEVIRRILDEEYFDKIGAPVREAVPA